MLRKYIVEGMMCAACQQSVERVVSKIEGVDSVSVNLISKLLLVECDKTVTDEMVFESIKKAGFTPSLYKEKREIKENDLKESKISIKIRLILSFVLLVPLLYVSMAKMLCLPLPNIISYETNKLGYIISQATLSLPILIINIRFFINGTKGIVKLNPNMDTLISLGSLVSYFYSLYQLINVINGKEMGMLFFDSSAMILALITIGKAIESKTKAKSNSAIEGLKSLIPDYVNKYIDGKEEKTKIEDIAVKDIIIVKAGEIVPLDSIIAEGRSYVDESSITGEYELKSKSIKEEVKNGTIVTDGYLILEVTNTLENSTVSKIINSAIVAGAKKANLQRIADKVSRIFVPTIIGLSIITFIIWTMVSKDINQAVKHAIEVLVVSCPCALGLATPVAVTQAIGTASKLGILVKEANVFEKINSTNTIIFDKTGTLTSGQLKISSYKSYIADKELFNAVYSLEEKTNHPIANALKINNVSIQSIENYNIYPGKGVCGKITDNLYIAGNKLLMTENNVETTEEANVYVAKNGELIGYFILEDSIKKESKELVNDLKSKGYKTFMISGDNYDSCLKIQNELGLDAFYNNILPDKKAEIINDAMTSCSVIYVGDGINDTVALETADVGISFGDSTDIAKSSSDVILLNDNLGLVDKLINLSRKTVKIIKENLFWAFIYNLIAIPIAAGVFSSFGISINPAIASLMMCLSSIIVVTNALRLRRIKK